MCKQADIISFTFSCGRYISTKIMRVGSNRFTFFSFHCMIKNVLLDGAPHGYHRAWNTLSMLVHRISNARRLLSRRPTNLSQEDLVMRANSPWFAHSSVAVLQRINDLLRNRPTPFFLHPSKKEIFRSNITRVTTLSRICFLSLTPEDYMYVLEAGISSLGSILCEQ